MLRPAMQKPIVIDTVFEHIRDGYEVRATCHQCNRTVTMDLHRLVREGKGNRSITRMRPWCARCHVHGQWLRFPPSRHSPRP